MGVLPHFLLTFLYAPNRRGTSPVFVVGAALVLCTHGTDIFPGSQPLRIDGCRNIKSHLFGFFYPHVPDRTSCRLFLSFYPYDIHKLHFLQAEWNS